MTPSAIAERLADPAALRRVSRSFSSDAEMVSPGRIVSAAVLVPIVAHPEEPAVLLTLRSERLSSHAG